MTRYSVDDLLQAYRRAAGRPMYGVEAVRVWNNYVLDCMCRCFEVSFDGAATTQLRAVLDHDARLPHPLSGYLEASLFVTRFEPVLASLDARHAELVALYRQHALALASNLWGSLGERTIEQLRATGWNPSREPKLDDYINEI